MKLTSVLINPQNADVSLICKAGRFTGHNSTELHSIVRTVSCISPASITRFGDLSFHHAAFLRYSASR